MAMKNRIIAFVAGVVVTLGVGVAWGGLETGTYISDLVATNPLSSDLASTADDHLRLIKSTVKTTFPNINNAVTATDEQLNTVITNVAANPTGTIGLSAVNGSAVTYLRSDGAPALSQAIAPTWTAVHTFSQAASTPDTYGVRLAGTVPFFGINETGAAANNTRWDFGVASEQMQFRVVNDAGNSVFTWMTVDRTANANIGVAFPSTDGSGGAANFVVGTVNTSVATVAQFRTTTNAATVSLNSSGNNYPLKVHQEQTSGNNLFVEFLTEGSGGTTRGSITYNRAGGLVAYNTTSADNAKRNIRPAKSARKVIDCIKVVSHDWKGSAAHMDYWVTAGTLDPCAPWAVSYDTKPEVDGKVDVSKLVPAMIKYMQEQDARIATLERRLH